MLDVDRVEILKGPQGTLYGQNATGGAINFIAAKPTNVFTAGVDATFARFDETKLDGFISGPLTPTLNARLAASIDEGGAWQRSDTRGDTLGSKDIKIVRLLLDWTPRDDLKVNVNINGWTDNSQRQAAQLEGYHFLNPVYITGQPTTNLAAVYPNPAYAQYYPAGIKAIVADPIAPANDRAADWVAGTYPTNNESYGQVSARLDYAVSDHVGLTSLSNYQHYSEHDEFDASGVNALNFNGIYQRQQRNSVPGAAAPRRYR